MKLITKIINTIFSKSKFSSNFTFPYSNNPEIKKQQIWTNLELGLLIEDKKTLLNWNSQFESLKEFNRKEKRGDRTTWYFSKYKILDGFELQFEAVKWNYVLGRKKFECIYSIISSEIAERLIKHLIVTIGLPEKDTLNLNSLEYYEGECKWTKNQIEIRISTAEFHGGYVYKLKIGIKEAVDAYL